MMRKFTEKDLVDIKKNLQSFCEKSWRERGYKQTNITLLTKEARISSGAFYLIYKRKEDLFVDVLGKIQKDLLDKWSEFIYNSESKIDGFKEGLHWIFNEYRSNPNLYSLNTPEYELLLAKLPETKVDELKNISTNLFRSVLEQIELSLILSEDETINIIHSILFISLIDSDTFTGTEKTFEFLLDLAMPNLFKEDNL